MPFVDRRDETPACEEDGEIPLNPRAWRRHLVHGRQGAICAQVANPEFAQSHGTIRVCLVGDGRSSRSSEEGRRNEWASQ